MSGNGMFAVWALGFIVGVPVGVVWGMKIGKSIWRPLIEDQRRFIEELKRVK